MTDVRDPGPQTVDRILTDLEEARWSPADVARQARRLRAHIEGLRERVRHCQNVHADDGLYDPELSELAGGQVDALQTVASPGRRRFRPK